MVPLSDISLSRVALDVARQSQKKGNLPFGCVRADPAGKVPECGEYTVVTDSDAIAHFEINLVLRLAGKYGAGFLSSCTIYAYTEPCPHVHEGHLLEQYWVAGVCA